MNVCLAEFMYVCIFKGEYGGVDVIAPTLVDLTISHAINTC